MSILQTLISNLLKEGKIEDLQARYPALNVKEIAKNDPTQQKKYLSWMCKQLSLGASENDLYPTVKAFDKNVSRIQNKDINSYKTAKELEDVIKSLPEKSKTQQREETKGNAPKVFEDDNVVVVRPDDKNSCVVYGANTKWCITMKNASYYEQYTSNNVVFYFIISKTLEQGDKNAKIALAMIRDDENKVKNIEVYDALDKQISEEKISPQILNLCKIDAEKQPMSLLAKIKSKKASNEDYKKAARSDDVEIRRQVAISRSTPVEVLFLLLKDEDSVVRSNLALSQKTPLRVLAVLSRDKDEYVRSCVAQNTNTPQEVLAFLSNDDNVNIRYFVAQNRSTSQEVLSTLSDDNNVKIRYYVAQNETTAPKTLISLSKNKDHGIHAALALNENAPQEILILLSKNENSTIRSYVAQNRNTSSEILAILARDRSATVRYYVTLHKNTSKEIIVVLLDDKDQNVRLAAQERLQQIYENIVREFVRIMCS